MNEYKAEIITNSSVVWGEEVTKFKLIDIRYAYRYDENNQKTDQIDSVVLEALCLGSDYSKYNIKIPIEASPKLQIGENFTLIGFSARLYARNNRVYWSIKAKGIKAITEGN